MADISKITPLGSEITYDLKDATAREQIAENKNNISNVQTSLAVGSSDDGKVLTASYSGGTGSYAWVTPSGGDVTGVKGSGETNYRTGNVSLSAANVGAIPTTEKGANGGVAALDSNGKIAADKIAAGALANGMTATTQETSDDSTKLATTAFVHDVVDSLPSPMVYKGTLGTGGTITTLPVDGTAEVGDTYKVITAGTYASQVAKIGDMFICLTKATSSNTWSYVPSGDDTDVTQVSAGTGLTTASGSPITTTGTIKAKLKSSTALAEAATNSTTTGKSYAVNVDSAGDLACNVPWTDTTYTFNTAYNASTNKAATMSDITTRAENGTLTGYEKKTGNVAATDKIVEAIGKLETKADTNATNIGNVQTQANWNTNNGVKNLSQYNNGTYSSPLIIPCNFKNGEIYTVSWSSITSTSAAEVSRMAFMSGDNVVSNIYYASHGVAGSTTLTLTADCDSLWLYAGSVYELGKTVTANKFMIRPTSIADSTFEPYALPNTKITPELIELVDSGAKNLYNPSNTSTSASGLTGTITRNSDGSYTINGTTSGTVNYNMGSWIAPEDGYYILSGGSAAESASQLIYDDHNWQTYESGDKKKLAYWNKGSTHNLYIRLGSGITLSNVTIYPMVCTKAAWDVSQKFVPNRPTYEETVEQIAENKNNISINSIKSSITMEQGYTLVTQSTLYQQGKHIFGNLIIKKDSGNYSDTSETVCTLGNPPAITGMLFCGFGASEWGIESIGYAFLGSTGGVSVKDTKNTNTTVNIAVDYVIS